MPIAKLTCSRIPYGSINFFCEQYRALRHLLCGVVIMEGDSTLSGW
jgi:hypothetical protein